MEINNNTTNTPPKSVINDPYFEEVKTKTTLSIDFVLWLYRFLKYWYLFAICILVCYGYARLKNKSCSLLPNSSLNDVREQGDY